MDKSILIIKRISAEIDELERLRSGDNNLNYDKEINRKKLELERVKNINIFDKEISFDIIRKLVSVVEGREYKLCYYDSSRYYDVDYRIACLVNENDGLRIQIAKDYDRIDKIDYSKNLRIPSRHDEIEYPCIVDFNYLYILEFMDYVVEYRLSNADYNISEKELRQLVDLFVSKYKNDINERKLRRRP